VTDASRAVGVASSLLSLEKKATFVSDVRETYAALRQSHARGRREGVQTVWKSQGKTGTGLTGRFMCRPDR